jgi:ribosomal subunit interface protein
MDLSSGRDRRKLTFRLTVWVPWQPIRIQAHNPPTGCVFNALLSKGGSMNLTISGHHLEVTPSLREYVLTKLDRVTRHFEQVVDINVLLTVEKQKEKDRRQRAEVNLHVKALTKTSTPPLINSWTS